MLWIGRDLTQRLRPRPEQDIVDDGLVLEGDDLDLLGHREHDVEVGHVEQFGLTVREPLGARETLALWATFVAARVVRDALMATIAARLDVTAKSGGAATLDREHGAPPRGGQRRAILITESRAEVTEHVRHFQQIGRAQSELQSHHDLVCRLLLEKKKKSKNMIRLNRTNHTDSNVRSRAIFRT